MIGISYYCNKSDLLFFELFNDEMMAKKWLITIIKQYNKFEWTDDGITYTTIDQIYSAIEKLSMEEFIQGLCGVGHIKYKYVDEEKEKMLEKEKREKNKKEKTIKNQFNIEIQLSNYDGTLKSTCIIPYLENEIQTCRRALSWLVLSQLISNEFNYDGDGSDMDKDDLLEILAINCNSWKDLLNICHSYGDSHFESMSSGWRLVKQFI